MATLFYALCLSSIHFVHLHLDNCSWVILPSNIHIGSMHFFKWIRRGCRFRSTSFLLIAAKKRQKRGKKCRSRAMLFIPLFCELSRSFVLTRGNGKLNRFCQLKLVGIVHLILKVLLIKQLDPQTLHSGLKINELSCLISQILKF